MCKILDTLLIERLVEIKNVIQNLQKICSHFLIRYNYKENNKGDKVIFDPREGQGQAFEKNK